MAMMVLEQCAIYTGGATCNYGFKGHVLKYHEIFFSRTLMFHFTALNCITTQIPSSLFFFPEPSTLMPVL